MRKFKLTPLLAALAAAVSVNAFAADASEDYSAYPTIEDIQKSIVLAAPVYGTNNTMAGNVFTAAEIKSRTNQWWLNNINRPANNALGTANGAGVVVGAVDTGAQTDHRALNGTFSATYNAFTKGTAITDERAHGTMVAGIIAGHIDADSPYEGVAPGAKIAMFKAFQSSGSTSNSIINQGIDWAVAQKVSVLNLSLGGSSPAYTAQILNATNNGVLVVAAMGNGGTKGAMYPAKYASNVNMNGRIIAVGALAQDNTRATFSSWDPALANWTVFAPGTQIYSSYSTPYMYDTFASMSGTSFAAPMVSGQAALIKGNWNFLKAETVAQIIFKTSTRLCSNGGNGMTGVTQCNSANPDPVFGWGLINIDRSLQPVGNLTLVKGAGTVVLSGTNRLLTSTKGGMAPVMSGVTTIGVDNFNRGYLVNLASQVSGTTTTASTPVTKTASTTTTATGAKFTADYAYANSNALGFGESTITMSRASFGFAAKDGSGYGLGFGGTSANYFGLASTGTTPLSLNGEAAKFNAPYFNFADTGTHAGYTMALNETTLLRMGAMTQGEGTAQALGFAGDSTKMALGTVELQKKFGNDTVVITAGNMQESNSALGMRGTGALALNANTSTNFVALAGSKQVSANTYISAMVSFGTTGEYTNGAASLIDGASATKTQAWSLGIAQKNVFAQNDSFGFTVSMPLRTMSGSVSVTTATAQSQEDGSLTYATQSMSLAPSGMEKDLELAYTRAQFGGNLSAIAQAKLEPGHVAGAATQYGIGVKWVKAF